MLNSLLGRIEKLEASLLPQKRIVMAFAKTPEEVEALHRNADGQSDLIVVTWLPPQE